MVASTDEVRSNKFLARFAPSTQISYCQSDANAFFGNYPTLTAVAKEYGKSIALTWLEVQLNDLSEFAGCRDKLSPARCSELAAMIAQDYPHYRLTEFMLFFQRFKRCQYGKFYGAVDPMIINGALTEFDSERRRAINRRRQEEQRRKEEEEAREVQREMQRTMESYRARVPNAGTDKAPISYIEYSIKEMEKLSDEEFAQILDLINKGWLKMPTCIFEYASTDFKAEVEKAKKKALEASIPEGERFDPTRRPNDGFLEKLGAKA